MTFSVPAELYPFESRYLRIGDHRLHYVDEGDPAAEPLLLLHGNPTWSFYYREIIRAFRQSHRVVAVDHMGCGLSDKPADYDYRLSSHIENVERLVRELDLDRVTLGVHDWGGAIGFGAAMRQPQRFRRFVVFNSAVFPGPVPWRICVCKWPLLGPLLVRGLNAFAGGAIYMACAHRERMTPAVRAAYLAPYQSWRDRVAILRFVQDIPTRPSHPTYDLIRDIEASLKRWCTHPMLICWGGRDFCFNDLFLQAWMDRFPQAEVHRFADAGHYVVEDAGERIVPLMRSFLAGGE